MTDDELRAQFPGFTPEQIRRGLTMPVVPIPSYWPTRLAEHEAEIAGDASNTVLSEYVEAEAQVEPFWKSLLGMICVVIVIIVACAFLYALS